MNYQKIITNRANRGVYVPSNPPCHGCFSCPRDIKYGYKPCPYLDKDLIEPRITN